MILSDRLSFGAADALHPPMQTLNRIGGYAFMAFGLESFN